MKAETGRVQTRLATPLLLLVVLQSTFAIACGMLPSSRLSQSKIIFEAGELLSKEETSLADLELACREAVETLGYEEIETTPNKNQIRLTARTVGGEPVELQLSAKGSSRTELRIRVGVLGNEARSRLVLEQIHQSL